MAFGGILGQVRAVSGIPEKVVALQVRIENHDREISEIKELLKEFHREQNSKLDQILNKIK